VHIRGGTKRLRKDRPKGTNSADGTKRKIEKELTPFEGGLVQTHLSHTRWKTSKKTNMTPVNAREGSNQGERGKRVVGLAKGPIPQNPNPPLLNTDHTPRKRPGGPPQDKSTKGDSGEREKKFDRVGGHTKHQSGKKKEKRIYLGC